MGAQPIPSSYAAYFAGSTDHLASENTTQCSKAS